MDSPHLVPVTLLTGFLGSGKTTLLNYILSQDHGRKIAVIENEIGEIAVDSALIIAREGDIFEMSNGCICCSVRGDFIETLNRLVIHRDLFDYILIESTGLASPGPIAQAFLIGDEVDRKLKLDGIVTLVDAKHIGNYIDDYEVACEQIAFSQVILLNKRDLVNETELDRVEKQLHDLNPIAHVIPTQRASVDLDRILNIGAFDLNQVLDLDGHDHLHTREPHTHGNESVSSVSLEVPGTINLSLFQNWLQMLSFLEGMELIRAKGILNIYGSERRYLFHSVYMMFEAQPDRPWGEQARRNVLVFIGKDLNRKRLEAGVRSCLVGN